MHHFRFAAALAAAAIVAPTAAPSQTAHTDRVTLQQWGQRIGDELNRRVDYPTLIGGAPFATGVVRVKINCSESGRPDKVALLKTSGSPALDRAALAAVLRIATLHPLPDGMRHDQQYQAVVLFASEEDDYRSQLRRIRAEVVKTNSWFKGANITADAGGPIMIGG